MRSPVWRWSALAVAIAGISAFLMWRFSAPAVPAVDTAGMDPAIANAIADARRTASGSPRSADARGRLGMVLLAHDFRAPAREAFGQASSFAPREPRWPYLLGLAQLIDEPEGAPTNLDRAVRLFPADQAAPRLKLADALLNVGTLDEAEAHYRQVWQRESNSAPAALGLGRIANARDRAADALPFLARASRDPSTRKAAHRLLVNVNQRLGNTNEAERLARAMADLPDDLPADDPILAEVDRLKTGEKAWTETGEELIKAGRYPEAIRLLRKTVEAYPKSDRAMFLLGRARLRQGDLPGAEEILSRAVALAPESIEAQMQLGVVRLNRGRPRDAQPCFRAAIQTKPNLPEAWYNLGLSLGGDPTQRAESMAAFREAIKLKPNLPEAYLALGVALRADGKNEAAVAELQRALALQPEEPLRRKIAEQLALAQRP